MVQFNEERRTSTLVTVGRRLSWGKFPSPPGVEYNWRDGQHLLYMALPNPTPQEIASVGRGNAEFALLLEGGLMLFLFHFLTKENEEVLPWGEAPFAVQYIPRDEYVPIDRNFDDGGHALLHIILVDSLSGVVKAMKATTFSPEFTRVLYQEIARQEDTEALTEAEYEAKLNSIRRRYPEVSSILPKAAARCNGGD